MTIDNAKAASDLIKKIDDLERQLVDIRVQASYDAQIEKTFILCKDKDNCSLGSRPVVVNSKETKMILKFMLDYYADEKEKVVKEIERLK